MGNFEHDFPAISDLRRRARRRMPHFVWEYLDSGTGEETALPRNRDAFDQITLTPRIMRGALYPKIETTFLGQKFDAPIGIAPIGAAGMMWPGAEAIFARLAKSANIPCGLSTVATRRPEDIGPLAGANGWFQLYPLGGDGVVEDVLRRARDAGFTALIVTVDVPINSRRERQRRAGFNVPPKLTPSMLAQVMVSPVWLAGIARHGKPRFRLMEDYVSSKSVADIAKRLSPETRPNFSWADVSRLRAAWDGPIILKGVMAPDDAKRAREEGLDAVWVSNHGGRQLDAAPAAIDKLPDIRASVGDDYPLIFDSGVRSGLDVAKALVRGADLVMCGRAFMYGAAAFGDKGARRCHDILCEDLINVMWQLGVSDLPGLRNFAES